MPWTWWTRTAALMSNHFQPRFAPLRYDLSRAFAPYTEISRTELIALNERLESARRELLCEREIGRETVPDLVDQPARMLEDYRQRRRGSELGRILSVGKRVRDAVDRVVLVAASDAMLGARALLEAGCHPYHNELSRGDRGGRPRIYFAGHHFDNDAVQALLDLLRQSPRSAKIDDRWAVAAIDGGGKSLESLAASRCLLEAQGDGAAAASPVVLIAAGDGSFDKLLPENGDVEKFDLPANLAGRHCMFTAATLLPAAVMGMDIVQLLQAAAMMSERFRIAPAGDNPALDHAAAAHVVGMRNGAAGCRFMPWATALDAAARWAESRWAEARWDAAESREENTPLGPRKRAPASWGGLQANLGVDNVRRDRIVLGGESNDSRGKSLTELQAEAWQTARDSAARDKIPSVDIVLPTLEESSLGQLFQMILLAAAVADRLRIGGPSGERRGDAHPSVSPE